MLEELVGEIHDEMDKTNQTVKEVKQGEIVVDGTEELRTVENHLDAYLSGKPTDSVNHWILAHVKHIPKAGERCHIDGLEVVVDKASRRRIRTVRLTCPNKGGIRAESDGKESDSPTADEGVG
jgi:putative hemolysin